MSLLWFNLSTSREGGNAGILLMWLLSRSSVFRRVSLYEAERLGWARRHKSRKKKCNSMSGDAKAGVPITAVKNIHHTTEFQMCASLPCHLSCGILRLFPQLLAAMVGKHQVQAVHWAAVHHFSVITRMRAENQGGWGD